MQRTVITSVHKIFPQASAVIGVLVCLGGCATPAADPARMAIGAPPERTFPPALHRAMCVRNVTGADETNPLYVSMLSNDRLRSALDTSLNAAGLTAAPAACKYPVDANLLGLSQPSIAYDLEVTTHINYKVYDVVGKSILLETISAAFTSKLNEAYSGMARNKLATEGSIRASIGRFMDKLSAVSLP